MPPNLSSGRELVQEGFNGEPGRDESLWEGRGMQTRERVLALDPGVEECVFKPWSP